ncbi:MAG: hypothetical protein ACHQ4H_05450 [Ktedonobacterales bacterium]
MAQLSDAAGEELAWVRIKWLKEQYELRAPGVDADADADAAVATLTLRGSGSAIATIGDNTFGFQRRGWFRTQVRVWRDPERQEVGVFSGGALALASGAQYHWRKPRFWTNERDWVDASGNLLVRLQPANWRASVRVICEPDVRGSADLALLVTLGALLLVLANQDAATAAVVTTVAASG